MARRKPAPEQKEKQPSDPYSNAQNPAQLAWCGLHIGTSKNRTLGGSAGLGPPLPLRFVTEPINLAAFQRDAHAACQALDTLLNVPELQEALNKQGDDLSVDDLLEPGPAEILAATTYEVEHCAAPQESDVVWQPWYIQQEQGAGLRQKGRRTHQPPAAASTSAAVAAAVADTPDGVSLVVLEQLQGASTEAGSTEVQEGQARGRGRPAKRTRRATAKALAAGQGLPPIAEAGLQPADDQVQPGDAGELPPPGEGANAPAAGNSAEQTSVGLTTGAATSGNAHAAGTAVATQGTNGSQPSVAPAAAGAEPGAAPAAPPPVAPMTITLQRKLPDAMTVTEWIITYCQHAWVFDRLGIPPPHLAEFVSQLKTWGQQAEAFPAAADGQQAGGVNQGVNGLQPGGDTTAVPAPSGVPTVQGTAEQEEAAWAFQQLQPRGEPQEKEEQEPPAKRRRGAPRNSKQKRKEPAGGAGEPAAAPGHQPELQPTQPGAQPAPGEHEVPPGDALPLAVVPFGEMRDMFEVPAAAATIRADLISAWRDRFQQASQLLASVRDLEAQHQRHAAHMRRQKEKHKGEQGQGGSGKGGAAAASGVSAGSQQQQQQQQGGRGTTPSLFSGEDDYDTFEAPQDAALLGQLQAATAQQGGASTTQQQGQGHGGVPAPAPAPARDGRSLNRGKKDAEGGPVPMDLLLVRSALSTFNREGQMRAAARSAEAALQADQLRQQMAAAVAPTTGGASVNLPDRTDLQSNPAFVNPPPGGPQPDAARVVVEGGDNAVISAADDALDPAGDEVLVNVAVYAPRRSDFLSDDLLLLGSQPLSALRDSLHCVAQANLAAANMQGSGGAYLFAEGRFFSDVRTPGAEDLATPIINLCKSKGVVPTHMVHHPGLGHQMHMVPEQEYLEELHWQQHQPAPGSHGADAAPGTEGNAHAGAQHADARQAAASGGGGGGNGQGVLTNQPMHQVPLASLTARLSNYPTYLFCHLGCCEHLIQIRDVRRLHPGDPLRRSAYPLQLLPVRSFATTRAARRCDVCGSNLATIAAYDDPLGPANPSFYCKSCQGFLHPGGVAPQGTKLFPYSHTSAGPGADG